jgi:hypothetical protein
VTHVDGWLSTTHISNSVPVVSAYSFAGVDAHTVRDPSRLSFEFHLIVGWVC